MDSGVSILNFSMCRKVLSLLKSITGLHQTTLEPLLLNFHLPGETMDTAWNGMTPIGVVPGGASRLWGMGKG